MIYILYPLSPPQSQVRLHDGEVDEETRREQLQAGRDEAGGRDAVFGQDRATDEEEREDGVSTFEVWIFGKSSGCHEIKMIRTMAHIKLNWLEEWLV